MNLGDIFNAIFLGPILNLLALIYYGLEKINIPGPLGFSIIVLTLGIRLLVWPVMRAQIHSARKLAELRPHLEELKKKHTDKQTLAQAQMALYKEHGVNPAGGCLPAVIQIPIFLALYQAITNILPGLGGSIEKINSFLYWPELKLSQTPDPFFLGVNLGVKPQDFGDVGIYLLLIPLITAILTFVQSKMMLPKPVKKYPSDSPKEKKEKESLEDSMMQVQSQMVYLMPIMIAYFSFIFPVGLAIYWNTYTIIGIVQQYMVAGWGGMAETLERFGVSDREITVKNPETKVRVERLKK